LRVTYQNAQIPAAGVVLEADIALPQEARGVVLFAHGSGSSRHSPRNRYVAEQLQHAGLATVLADLLTAEEERIDALTAELRFDIGLLATRLAALTDWLTAQERTAGLGIGLFGASTGAAAPTSPANTSHGCTSRRCSSSVERIRSSSSSIARPWRNSAARPA
jgi:putative phosphoribosyl transferase